MSKATLLPGKCQSCGEVHPAVAQQAQAVARCECGGKLAFDPPKDKFPNREPETGFRAKSDKGAKSAKGFSNTDFRNHEH